MSIRSMWKRNKYDAQRTSQLVNKKIQILKWGKEARKQKEKEKSNEARKKKKILRWNQIQ